MCLLDFSWARFRALVEWMCVFLFNCNHLWRFVVLYHSYLLMLPSISHQANDIVVVVTSRMLWTAFLLLLCCAFDFALYHSFFLTDTLKHVHIIFVGCFFFLGSAQKHSKRKQMKCISCTTATFQQDTITVPLAHQIKWLCAGVLEAWYHGIRPHCKTETTATASSTNNKNNNRKIVYLLKWRKRERELKQANNLVGRKAEWQEGGHTSN